MLLAILAIIVGLLFLVISADRFVEGAAVTSKHLGLPPLLIGMLVIGFGSSVPEMVISFLASYNGNPSLALGNAFGSNITNIALILGLTAIISPIAVGSTVIRRELPLLVLVTVLTGGLLYSDGFLSRTDGLILTSVFLATVAWTIYQGVIASSDHLAEVVEQEMQELMPLGRAVVLLTVGLAVLVISSRILVWGGVEVALRLGISDLIIGLTIVALGTSLPELASSITAVRKNEHELALGNVIGSNLFNITIVIGITGTVAPLTVDSQILSRDIPVLAVMTIALFIMCYGFRGSGRINRYEGAALLLGYVGYNGVLLLGAMT